MPDTELFKLVMNGGMFGLWAIFIIWLLFYGAPMFRDALKDMGVKNDAAAATTAKALTDNTTKHAEIASLLASKHESIAVALAAKHETIAVALAAKGEATAVALAAECREERKEAREENRAERAATLAVFNTEREKDRQAKTCHAKAPS